MPASTGPSDPHPHRSSRRSFLLGLMACGAAAALAGCQTGLPAGPASPRASGASAAAKPAGWDGLVQAAVKEGSVNVYGGIAGGQEALTGPFEQAFPGIKVNGTFLPAGDLVSRLLAERTAKKFIADVTVGLSGESVTTLKPAGALSPLEPALLLPEVTDLSAWLDKQLWWMDANTPNSTLQFHGYVATSVAYNSKLVDPAQFHTYRDLLDPKWKGKIVAYDIRRRGGGGGQTRFIYNHPDLGPTFMQQLFSGITLSADQRQMVDWLGQGRYLIGLWIGGTEMNAGVKQGLPVAQVPGDQFKEGSPLSAGGGTVSLVDSAPHPNAARVLINWLLSREGQTTWQRKVLLPSLRVDVSREGLDPTVVPTDGKTYVDSDTEEYIRRTPPDVISNLITKAIETQG